MFEYYQNTLCVRANWLDETGIITETYLRKLSERKKVIKARCGRGLDNYSLYVYESLPQRFRNVIEHDLGIDPYEESKVIRFAEFLEYSENAAAFFSNYELEDGRFLSEASIEAVNEYTANACVLHGIQKLSNKILSANPKTSKGVLWDKITDSIHHLPESLRNRYPFDLPANSRALRAKYEACILEKPNKRYPRVGLEGLIHDNYCNSNSAKITGNIAKWLLAQYSLPVKYSIYKLLDKYNEIKEIHGWPTLSESGIQNFIQQPENERIWTLPREGRDEYIRKYGHTLTREKSRLFPNAYWAIDGTKLDAVHVWDNSNKMAALVKINILIDVYSEKILGYSFSQTENHVDHFIAVKMAIGNAGHQPYLFTYDKQSGHKSKRMQELYSKVIAKGGTHYSHKVGRKSNPIEQVFNRLQQQVITKRWFSDGQGIKSKQNSSKRDVAFIEENKQALPTMDELQKHWEVMVSEWNNMPRKKGEKSRNEFYAESTDLATPLDTLTQISMFWLNETKPKKYYAHGMPLTVAGKDYLFEVYDANGNVDLEFRRKYVQQKLIVSYDPEYLDEYIALYRETETGDKVFVAYAETKRAHESVPVLMKEGEREQWLKDLKVREQEELRDWNAYLEIAESIGVTRESLIEEQNAQILNNEFNAKRSAYATKEEQLITDSNSLFEKMTR